MEYHEIIKQRIDIYEHFLRFIDEEIQTEEHYKDLIEIIQKHKYNQNPENFKSILYLISEISKNHHRSDTFLNKIERIISHYSEYIKQSFTKLELVKLFKKNPQILHYLFITNIITFDNSIINMLFNDQNKIFVIRKFLGEKTTDYQTELQNHMNKKSILHNYGYYFFMDIRPNLDEEIQEMIKKELFEMDENILNDFEKKCQIGQNDSYISELIREDSIKEFIIYVNKINLQLNSEMNHSIFETNPLLIQKRSKLIEYAAFFGSIQIFQYLLMNNVELTPSLWLYAIHGRNPEIIHLLEENHVEPYDKTYTECFKESIKCHHNEIAKYIEINLLKEKIEMNERNFKNNSICYGFHYYNFEFIKESLEIEDLKFPFFYACLYDHFQIVELLIRTKKVDLNQTIIQYY